MLAISSHYDSKNYIPGYEANIKAQPLVIPTVTDRAKRDQFEEIFIPLLDSLYNMALRLTRNSDDAEDLVQETYLKAYRFRDMFRENTNARAWIMTVLINTFRTEYRKLKKEPTKVDYDSVENYLPDDGNAHIRRPAINSEVPNIENITEYMRSVVSDDIINALESIPIRYRMPVLLSDVEQFNYQEISEILRINIGTVKSRIFRGRRMLKKNLFEFAVERGICRRR